MIALFPLAAAALSVIMVLLPPELASAQEATASLPELSAPSAVEHAERAPPAPSAAPPPIAAPPYDSWAEYIRAQEIVHLRVRADLLHQSSRRLLPPGVLLGLGITSLIVGGIVFASAWSGYEEEYSVAKDRAGLIMMPVGAVLTIAAVPVFAVHLARTLRLQRVERALHALGDR
jgi:hypothetical protein